MSTPQDVSSANQYQLLLTGEVIDGHSAAQAQTWLAKALKVTPAKAAVLLTGEERCIKTGLDQQTAERYRDAFVAQGIEAKIHSHKNTVQDSSTNPPSETQRLSDNDQNKAGTSDDPSTTQVVQTRFFNGERASNPGFLQKLVAITVQCTGILLISGLYATAVLSLLLFSVHRIAGLFTAPPETIAGLLLTIVLPFVVATALLLMLLRPVFNQDTITPKQVPLDLREQEKLASFIRELSQNIHCPAPDLVYLSNDLGCTEEYRCTFPRLFDGERILSIGAPLVTTCSVRQLAALIAHEQTLLRSPMAAVANTCARNIYRRFNNSADNSDGWTLTVDRLEHKAREPSQQATIRLYHHLLSFSALLIRPFARLSSLAHTFSFHYAVFVADHVSISLTGTPSFIETLTQLHTGKHALQQAAEKIFNDVDERRLANNLPFLVRHFVGMLPEKNRKFLDDEVERGETRSDVDYPNDRERIIYADDLDISGIDCIEQPATELFEHLEELCRQSTLLYYHNQGLVVDESDLVDISKLINSTQQDQIRDELSASYFNHWFTPQTYWSIPAPGKIKELSPQQRINMLNNITVRIRHNTREFMQLHESEDRCYQALVQLGAAAEVRKAGYSFAAADFNFSNEQVNNFTIYYDKARKEYESLKQRQRQLQELMGKRIFLGVATHPESDKRQLGVTLLQVLACMHKHANRLNTLRVRVGFLPILSARMQERKETELNKKIQRVTRDIRELTREALTAFEKLPCNFSRDYQNLGQFIQAHIKQQIHENSPPLEAVSCYAQVLFGMSEANTKINNQLAFICKDSEQANKISPVKLT